MRYWGLFLTFSLGLYITKLYTSKSNSKQGCQTHIGINFKTKVVGGYVDYLRQMAYIWIYLENKLLDNSIHMWEHILRSSTCEVICQTIYQNCSSSPDGAEAEENPSPVKWSYV